MSPMFVPGPVDVDPEVAAAQTQPMLPHRSKCILNVIVKGSWQDHMFICAQVCLGSGLTIRIDVA